MEPTLHTHLRSGLADRWVKIPSNAPLVPFAIRDVAFASDKLAGVQKPRFLEFSTASWPLGLEQAVLGPIPFEQPAISPSYWGFLETPLAMDPTPPEPPSRACCLEF